MYEYGILHSYTPISLEGLATESRLYRFSVHKFRLRACFRFEHLYFENLCLFRISCFEFRI